MVLVEMRVYTGINPRDMCMRKATLLWPADRSPAVTEDRAASGLSPFNLPGGPRRTSCSPAFPPLCCRHSGAPWAAVCTRTGQSLWVGCLRGILKNEVETCHPQGAMGSMGLVQPGQQVASRAVSVGMGLGLCGHS